MNWFCMFFSILKCNDVIITHGVSPVVLFNITSQAGWYTSSNFLSAHTQDSIITLPWVEYCVVLCGNADKSSLPEDERDFVFSLEEFCKIGKPEKYKKIFSCGRKPQTNSDRPNQNIQLWDKFFIGNSIDFKPKTYSFNNYVANGQPLFSHQEKIYQEFQSNRRDNPNYKALMRRWNFSAEAIIDYAQTMEERNLIGFRESDVLGFIDAQNEELRSVHLNLLQIPNPEETTADFCELYEWPNTQLRVDEFIVKNKSRLTTNSRLDLIQALLSQLARIHDIDVAHRDIGRHSVWLSLPSKVKFSNFVTASYPDPNNKTMSSVRNILQSGRTGIPEDIYDDSAGTPFTRDVYLTTVVAHYIAYDCWPNKLDGVYSWNPRDEDPYKSRFDLWFATGLELDASLRFKNMEAALDAFNQIHNRDLRLNEEQNSAINQFLTDTNIYITYQPSLICSKNTEMLFKSNKGQFGIKLWNGVSQLNAEKSSNHHLLVFLHRTQSIKNAALDCIAKIDSFGFNPTMQCLFVVYQWVEGVTWNIWIEEESTLNCISDFCLALLKSIESLHTCHQYHGDIHPKNIIVNPKDSIQPKFIDFLNYNESPTEPYNPSYVPLNHDNLSLEARDRYAIVKIISEAARKANAISLIQYSDLLCQQDEISPGDLKHFIDNYQDILLPPEKEKLEQYTVICARLGIKDIEQLVSNEGIYYISRKINTSHESKPRVRIFISGLTHQLVIHFNLETKLTERITFNEISHSQFIRNKRNAEGEVKGAITLAAGPADDANILIESTLSILPIEEHTLTTESCAKEDYVRAMNNDDKGNYIARDIWTALVTSEEESYPSVIAIKDSEHTTQNEIIIQYTLNGTPIDFDLKQDTVNVQREISGNFRTIGKLKSYTNLNSSHKCMTG